MSGSEHRPREERESEFSPRKERCGEVQRQIPFYCYGEVDSDSEERVESHISECPACREELARHRAFLELLDAREDARHTGEAASLLLGCRTDLRQALAQQREGGHRHWLNALRDFANFHIPFKVPVGAMALVALGFFGARYTPEKFGGMRADLTPAAMFSNVRSVEPDASGKVQISVDEVRRHVVSGELHDPRIQELLLSAAREESNPGVRVESIGVLKDSADSEQVRETLLYAVTHDPNAGVRLKALEGLKPYAGNAAVRRTLAVVLQKDDNPGVRVQAIDLLTTHHDDSIVGVLQDVVQKEDNNYVRQRCSRLLEEMKASVGTY
ncbi:MAG: HEAT repeat domain-containing protein [Acidobacteriota bacterium]|nr:HEAT repeat domain-containing protein [Acidobacteriota bacterium]